MNSLKVFFIILGIMCFSMAWAKPDKNVISKSYQEKVSLLEALISPENANNPAYLKKAMAVYEKNFDESDLDAMISYYQSPTGKKYLSSNFNHEMDAVLLSLSEFNKSDSALKDKNLDKEICAAELKYLTEDIEKGLARYKQVCESNKFPDTLDRAYDGKADYDNIFFNRVTSFTRKTNKWSKKGNTYSYSCGGEVKTFVYDSQAGTFK